MEETKNRESTVAFTKLYFYLQSQHEKALRLSGTKHIELMESLTHRQIEAFFVVGSTRSEYPEGMRIPELAGYLHVSPVTASALVAEMEEKDLFVKKDNVSERHVVRFTLSVLGTTIWQLFDEQIEIISEKQLALLPDETRKQFIEAVRLICRDFGK